MKLGAIVQRRHHQHDDDVVYDNGFAIEGAVGYRLNENLALEFSAGRFSISGEESGYLSIPGMGTRWVTAKNSVVGYPVLATAKLTLPLDNIEFVGLVGGGIYFLSSDVEMTSPGYEPLTDSDTDSPFAFHLGGGINVRVSPRAVLGAEVKYVIGLDELYDTKSHFDGIIVGAALAFSL